MRTWIETKTTLVVLIQIKTKSWDGLTFLMYRDINIILIPPNILLYSKGGGG